jgi:hypothetical protein
MREHTTVGVEQEVLHEHMKRMARTDRDWQVRMAALDFIHDADALDQVAASDPSLAVRQRAAELCVDLVEQWGELDVLELTREASATLTRVAATRRVRNPAALAQLASSQFDEQVRATAVDGIAEQQVLCHIAANDAHWSVRLAAIERVEATNVLAIVAARDRNDAVRLAARARLTSR